MNVWRASKRRLRWLVAQSPFARLDPQDRVVRSVKITEALRAAGHVGIGDPMRVFQLPLDQLNSFLGSREFGAKVPIFGVCGGDWDLKAHSIESLSIYRLYEQHFISGVRWEKTEAFDEFRREAHKTNRNLDPEYLQYVDRLFEAIKTQGYKKQSELRRHGDFLRRRAGTPFNEVQIFVGRDGQCMVKMGLHRTVLAKLLRLEAVPVRTRLRHVQWQSIRDELIRVGETGPLSEKARRHVNHPELADIRLPAPSPRTGRPL